MTPQTRQILALIFLGAQLAVAQNLFAPKQAYAAPNPSKPAFGDFNVDGKLDMVVLSVVEETVTVGQSTSIINVGYYYFFAGQSLNSNLFAQPVVTRSAINVISTVVQAGSLYAADFDKDSKLDLLFIAGNSSRFLKGAGDGSFGPGTGNVASGTSQTLLMRDFNGDGNLDLFSGEAGRIRYGNGSGAFPTFTNVFPSCNGASLQLGDLNRDGREDAVNDCETTNVVRVAYRNSDGSFAAPVDVTNFSGRPVIADFNGDGINDLLVMRDSQAVIRYGAQNGTLLAASSASVPPSTTIVNLSRYSSVVAGDLNFDGIQDLIVLSDSSRSWKVLQGSSPGLFTEQSTTALGQVFLNDGNPAIELVDLNGDGGKDFYTWDAGNSEVSVYLTQPPAVFLMSNVNPIAPGMPVTLSAVVGSPATGVVYPNGGLVTFFSGFNALGGPVALTNGQALFTTSVLPVGIHYLAAKYQRNANSPVSASNLLTVIVTPNACGLSGPSLAGVALNASGYRFDRNLNQFVQDVDLTNRTAGTIQGPISLMVAGLSANATLATPHSFSTCNEPGAPVVDAGICPTQGMAPNQTVRVTLRFNNPTRTAISYSPQTIAGLGRR